MPGRRGGPDCEGGWSGTALQGSDVSAERSLGVSRLGKREQQPRPRVQCVQRAGGEEDVGVFVEVEEGQGGGNSG